MKSSIDLPTLPNSLISLLFLFQCATSAFAENQHHSRASDVEPHSYDNFGFEATLNSGIGLADPVIPSVNFARSLFPRQSQCCGGNLGCCDPGNVCLPTSGKCCAVGNELCKGWGCFTPGTSCCGNGQSLTGTCPPGWKCTSPTQCCPNDYNICSNGRCCPPGQKCIAGGGCCGIKEQICSNNRCCPEGTICWRYPNGNIGCRGTPNGNNPPAETPPDFPGNDADGDDPNKPDPTPDPPADPAPEPAPDPPADPPPDPPAGVTTTERVVVTTTVPVTASGIAGVGEDATDDGLDVPTSTSIRGLDDESSTRTIPEFETGLGGGGSSAAATVSYSGWSVCVGMVILGWAFFQPV